MHIVLRFFKAVSNHNTAALLMDFEHVPLCLFTSPTENLLKHMGHIGHEVDRIIPDDDGIILLTNLLGIRLHIDVGRR